MDELDFIKKEIHDSIQNETMSIVRNVNAMSDRMEELITRAFVNGDLEGHRNAHSIQMEELAERRKLRMAIQEKTISGLIWAAIVGISIACWLQLKSWVMH